MKPISLNFPNFRISPSLALSRPPTSSPWNCLDVHFNDILFTALSTKGNLANLKNNRQLLCRQFIASTFFLNLVCEIFETTICQKLVKLTKGASISNRFSRKSVFTEVSIVGFVYERKKCFLSFEQMVPRRKRSIVNFTNIMWIAFAEKLLTQTSEAKHFCTLKLLVGEIDLLWSMLH